MSSRFVVTIPAKNDIRDILLYVDDRFGRVIARRVHDELYALFQKLAETPGIGRPRPDRWPEQYRFFPHGPSLIAYRADTDPIRIIRIARGSMDWKRIDPLE